MDRLVKVLKDRFARENLTLRNKFLDICLDTIEQILATVVIHFLQERDILIKREMLPLIPGTIVIFLRS